MPMKLEFLGSALGSGGSPGTLPAQKAGSHERDKRAAKCPPRGHPSAVVRGVDGQPIPCRDRRGRTGKQADECDAERGDPTHRWRCMIGSLHLRNVEHDAGQRYLLGW